MAQPIRSSGCRPVTSHSNARGTSGTRPGKRLSDLGRRGAGGVGGAPDHNAAGLVEFRLASSTACAAGVRVEKQMGPRRVAARSGLASCASPATASAGGWCAAQNCRRRNSRSPAPAARSRSRRCRSRAGTSVVANTAERGRDDRRPPTPSATAAGAGDATRSPVATITASPDISSATPAPPTTRSRSNRPEIRLPDSAGADREEIDEIARQRIDRRPIDDRRLFRDCGEPAGVEHDQQHDAGHRQQAGRRARRAQCSARALQIRQLPAHAATPASSARISQIR